jgi:hypothetical protein
MNKLLDVAAAIEAATGLALMIYPPILSRLLLGEDVFGAGIALGRIAGFALLALGLACWPGIKPLDRNTPALRALLLYNLLATLYLAYLGIRGRPVGSLLWPAVALHCVLSLLLARGLLRSEWRGWSSNEWWAAREARGKRWRGEKQCRVTVSDEKSGVDDVKGLKSNARIIRHRRKLMNCVLHDKLFQCRFVLILAG